MYIVTFRWKYYEDVNDFIIVNSLVDIPQEFANVIDWFEYERDLETDDFEDMTYGFGITGIYKAEDLKLDCEKYLKSAWEIHRKENKGL